MQAEILIVILGWALGLLSVPIVSKVDKYFKRSNFKNVLLSELKYQAVRLIMCRFLLQSHNGTTSKEKVKWIKDNMSNFSDFVQPGMLEGLEKVLDLDDEDILSWGQKQAKLSVNKFLGLKTFRLPMLENNLKDIWVFSKETQKLLLEIYNYVQILNEEIELSMYYSKLTFDSGSEKSKEVIEGNIKKSYTTIDDQCGNIVGIITKLCFE
jgi:hypothetical protein